MGILFTVSTSELVGISEVADLAGVTRQAVGNWKARDPSFPKPLAELKSGPVWQRKEIVSWLRRKRGTSVAKVISFINLKGGVGKTTSAVAVSEFLADEHGKHVLLIDLDPQTNATTALIPEIEWQNRDLGGQTLKQLFLDKLKHTSIFNIHSAIIHGTSNVHGGIQRLSLLPSSLGLIELQDDLAHIPGGNFYAVSPVDVLREALSPIIDGFDYVIIDCPPNLGIITLNGINISDGYIIPVIPDILSTYGIDQIINRVTAFSKAKGLNIPPIGILVSKFRTQSTLHVSKLNELRGRAAAGNLPPIFDTVIPEAARIAESADFSAPVGTLRQKYGYGNNYERYSALAAEFLARC